MDKMYLFVEYGKVLIAYAALCYAWPCIIFRGYLKGKGLSFRFMFCHTAQMLLINGVVLGLGIFHLLKPWIVRSFFWGALAVSAGISFVKRIRRGTIITDPLLRNFLSGTCGLKMFLSRIVMKPMGSLKKDKEKRTECILLMIVTVFGMAYFSCGAFQFACYGTSDQFTHHLWITGLQQGNIFAEGIYPEGMHCFIYSMNALFGVSVYYSILFLAGIYSAAFLLSVYLLLKEVFQYRFTALFVLTAFLTFGSNGQGLEAMSRLTWTLPQEFGLYLVFLCPLFLFRFFRGNSSKSGKSGAEKTEWYEDENLLLLMAGVGAAVSIHFYVLILAFVSCLAVTVIYFRKMLSWKNLKFLSGAVFYGMEAGCVPMAAAYIMGMEPQDSLGWGISTMRGVSEEAVRPGNAAAVSVSDFLTGIYKNGPVRILGENPGRMLVCVGVMLLAVACGCITVSYFKRKRGQTVLFPERMADGYFWIAVVTGLFVFLYAMPYVGLPELVANGRLFGIVQIFVLTVFGGAADFLLFMINRRVKQRIMRAAAVFGCIAVYCCAYFTNFHEFSHWWVSRHMVSTFVTERIIKNLPDNTYTIVSADEELYQTMGKGRHEELLDFVKGVEREEYFIPTEYIFLYVEKQAISYEKSYFYTGPFWLAKENARADARRKEQSLYPGISEEAAEETIDYFPEPADNYRNMENRNVLNAKAFAWYQEFSKDYPAETNTYYEDDQFACYMIHQNPFFQQNLVIEKG